jgi:hypothetical protein
MRDYVAAEKKRDCLIHEGTQGSEVEEPTCGAGIQGSSVPLPDSPSFPGVSVCCLG